MPGVDAPETDQLCPDAKARAGPAELRLGAYQPHGCAIKLASRAPRGLDRTLFLKLTSNDWIRKHRNCLIVGPAGIGKSWLGCALGDQACREDFSVLYYRVPRSLTALALAHGDGRYARLLRSISRADLLILDDVGPEVLTTEQRRDLLEIVEDRYNARSLLITSQIPIKQWYDIIGNSTLADAILDRIVHNAYRIELSGETLRDRIDDTIDGASLPQNQTTAR